MWLDWLVLGLGASSRGIKNSNKKAAGRVELNRLNALPVWERVEQQCCKSVTINGIQHHFLTPHEIILNKKWWNSGLELEEFLINFYVENHKTFFPESVRMIDKSGKEHLYSGYDVLQIYNKWEEVGKLKNK